MSLSREYIEDIVKNGLVIDIFKFERAIELVSVIGEKSDLINKSNPKNFGELFGLFQSLLVNEAILSATRIFDNPSKIYPTRCLLGLLNYLETNSEQLPGLRDPHQISLNLKRIDAPKELIETVLNSPNLFATNFSKFIRDELNLPERIDALNKLKTFRDKSIAHNEKIEQIFGPTWNSLKDLVLIPKNVIGVLGWAYFNTAYVMEGEYILSQDAKILSIDLEKILNLIYS